MVKARNGDEHLLAEINITPFTDVLLVLLIIFMILAALVAPPGFERTLQHPKPAPKYRASTPIVSVVISRAGQIRVNGRLVSSKALYGVMQRIYIRDARAHVALYADVHAPYGAVIRVLDAAKAARVTDVSFVTE